MLSSVSAGESAAALGEEQLSKIQCLVEQACDAAGSAADSLDDWLTARFEFPFDFFVSVCFFEQTVFSTVNCEQFQSIRAPPAFI